MYFLIGLILSLALLYFWLVGHWFARILVFLLLIPVGYLLIALGLANLLEVGKPTGLQLVLCAIVGAILAWFGSMLPIYYWRGKFRAQTSG